MGILRAASLACFILASAAHADEMPATARSCWPGEPGTDPRACAPNDEGYRDAWEFWSTIPESIDLERMHPAERALGSIGISLDRAWQHTIGRDDVVIAVLDSGIRWDYADLINKIYINRGELPPPAGSTGHDADGNGLFDVRDYHGDQRVGDRNRNGVIDAGDLILAFSDCEDNDGNGYPDDIAGYDFFGRDHCGFEGGDNDPFDVTDFGHGTGIGSTAAAETDNLVRDAGVCPRCRVLPVRVGDSFVVDVNRFARGLTYAVRAGASVVASALGSYNNTPAGREAIDLAYRHGVPVIASAADEFAYHHNYPSVYNHALYVNAIRFNHADDYREASTFWGVNPCTNFGARVWITVPAESCSSGATSRLAGVAGLVESIARDAGHGDLHAEEVYQILRASADDLDNTDPDWGAMRYTARPGFDQFYGYGRLNAWRAVTMAEQGRIPPIADLADPDWFAVVSPKREPRLKIHGTIETRGKRPASYRLEYGLGVEPAEGDYVKVAEGSIEGSYSGRLGVLDFTRLPLPTGPSPRDRDERDRYSVTLRLSVADGRGPEAEARRSFFVFDDPSWKTHFPLALGASGEAGPLLVDLDGDGRDEIVLPTA
ncbi:MAG TPA: S8 family serine peptidase, partial [Candidatus Polarisedimenticolaceae bacterium]|nr:S8 family serine peptidase [Candidatus Polarisedimenticolaceae bacterium]